MSTASAPKAIDLAVCGLEPPQRGRLLALAFTRDDCAGCSGLARRLERLAELPALDVVVLDTEQCPETARAVGIDRLPTVFVVDPRGAVVRAWVGEPLAGTLERTVLDALG